MFRCSTSCKQIQNSKVNPGSAHSNCIFPFFVGQPGWSSRAVCLKTKEARLGRSLPNSTSQKSSRGKMKLFVVAPETGGGPSQNSSSTREGIFAACTSTPSLWAIDVSHKVIKICPLTRSHPCHEPPSKSATRTPYWRISPPGPGPTSTGAPKAWRMPEAY